MVIIMKTGQTDDFVVKLKHSNNILGFYLQKVRILETCFRKCNGNDCTSSCKPVPSIENHLHEVRINGEDYAI